MPVCGHITLEWTYPLEKKNQSASKRKVRLSSMVPPLPSRYSLLSSLEFPWLTVPADPPGPWVHPSWSLRRHLFFPLHGWVLLVHSLPHLLHEDYPEYGEVKSFLHSSLLSCCGFSQQAKPQGMLHSISVICLLLSRLQPVFPNVTLAHKEHPGPVTVLAYVLWCQ